MLNKSSGNMYSWITHTWNTVRGACPHGCSYCYMKRWGEQKPVHFDEKELKTDLGKDNFIFVGSSCDMFASDVPMEWITKTLDYCAEFKKNKYLFQSKNPARMAKYDGMLAFINAVACTTIETNRWYPDIMHNSPFPEDRAFAMSWIDVSRYVTIEPIMDFDLDELVYMIRQIKPVQVNIGADSGNNHLPEPSMDKVLQLIEGLQGFTTIHQKRNLDRLIKS